MTNNTPQFDFSKVGKRTPYRTPDGYFELSEQTLRAKIQNYKSQIISLKWVYGIAASLILAVGIWSLVRFLPQPTPSTSITDDSVYAQTYDASDDWSDFADADIFLDYLNW